MKTHAILHSCQCMYSVRTRSDTRAPAAKTEDFPWVRHREEYGGLSRAETGSIWKRTEANITCRSKSIGPEDADRIIRGEDPPPKVEREMISISAFEPISEESLTSF